MPPSPSLRCSPGKGLRADSHKRGRSLESGLSFKERDDDLALFSELQNKEEDNFLLQSTEDLSDILSTKLKPLHDFKLGIAIPSRGESSDLLNIDGDKNDYDWLLTPPDTPLFPSLDDEPPPANLVYSGRPRSRPISISRSPTMEKNYRSSRGSASPQRSSQSPCSSASTTFQSRGRPSSAPRSSPSPILRHGTPTRRPSPPPVKPSTPPPRSSTPTPRRSGTGSITGVKGPSPVRLGRGNSSSPKVRAWKSNIPGFSLEAPPNLRTSLSDRPASYVRGSSPASRNSRDSSSMFRRQSMSPTATRSISSSHSHERDQFSSHSKGSVASSGDDDADSFLSPLVSGSDHNLSQRGIGGFPSNRPVTFSKKPTKTSYPSSAPKRSFDAAIRQMDKRSPQNMFRPLLSSVPSTTFYGGKASSSHRTMISINSSLTTSSNASSDQVTSGAPDTEGSEHNQEDVESEIGRICYSGGHEEVFAFDKMDTVGEDSGLEVLDHMSDAQPDEHHRVFVFESKTDEMDGYYRHGAGAISEAHREHYVDVATILCSRCGCRYTFSEPMDDDMNLCRECKQKEGVVVNISQLRVGVPLSSSDPQAIISEEVGSANLSKPSLAAPEYPKVMEMGRSATDALIIPDRENERELETPYQELSKSFLLDGSDAQPVGDTSSPMISDMEISEQQTTVTDGNSHDNHVTSIDVTEGAGISVLLSNRPSSGRGPVIQGRSFTATAVLYDVRSYTRDSLTSMRSSIGCGSVSTSSSIDMTFRHNEMPMQRQSSAKKSDLSCKPESIGSSLSRTSSYLSQGLGLVVNTHEENFDSCDGNGRQIATEEPETPPGPVIALENAEMVDSEASISRMTLLIKDDDRNSRANDYSGFELSNGDTQLEDNSSLKLAVDEDHNLHVVDNLLQTSADISDSATIQESPITEESNTDLDKINQREVSMAPHDDPATMPEIEFHDCHPGSPGLQNGRVSGDASEETSGSSLEAKGEPTVMLEDQEGRRARSLTLEEATDTILFCSSIIHDLAYKAASIAIEKEKENLAPVERLIPTITSTDYTSSSARDPHGRSTSKRTSKAHKSRREEIDTTLFSTVTETNDVQPVESPTRNIGLAHRVDSMKPPPKLESKCNCSIM
ncbi:hypothetical protein V2J09_019901 [Rumex salicifolius]